MSTEANTDAAAEPVELFDAANIEHAKKLAAALWAVDIVVTSSPAPPMQKHILKAKPDAPGEFEIDARFPPEPVSMVQLMWVAKFGSERYGNAIIIPAANEPDGYRALSANMVSTMLALVVNGTIGRADVDHGVAN